MLQLATLLTSKSKSNVTTELILQMILGNGTPQIEICGIVHCSKRTVSGYPEIASMTKKSYEKLLMKKQNSAQEVAEFIGYYDIPTFHKYFVDTYGITPSTYADSTNSHS